jgi:NADH-quinone oxidoreductase subunit N
VRAPTIDYLALSPLLAVTGGAVACLMAGLLRARWVQRAALPLLAAASLVAALALIAVVWQPGDQPPLVAGALAMDTLTLAISALCLLAGLATVVLGLRSAAARETGQGEWLSLLLSSIAGMVLLAGAESLVTLFIGIELLSIPLYVLCGTAAWRRESLESGLKYLVIGSVGSATLLYGLALIYGATGRTELSAIAEAIRLEQLAGDPLLLTGVALTAAGLAFKASVAPFHQWTPDVYQGAPTPVTAFMAVATKAAAFGVTLRLFDAALPSLQLDWGPALAALAVATIVIGNVGAITQDSLKRMLAWSGVAQAGYMLAGVVVGTRLGLEATVLYLAVYLPMNLAAFAVVIARERVSEHGDGLRSLEGLGAASPLLAWPMTLAMLALAGFPFTAGFIGKFHLIQAAVAGRYEWLGVAIVVGSMLSLVYYLRVIATMWMGPTDVRLPTGRIVRPAAGWSPEADARAQPEVSAVAVVMAVLILAVGIYPEPLFALASEVGTSLSSFVG